MGVAACVDIADHTNNASGVDTPSTLPRRHTAGIDFISFHLIRHSNLSSTFLAAR